MYKNNRNKDILRSFAIIFAIIISTLCLSSCSQESKSRYDKMSTENIESSTAWQKAVDKTKMVLNDYDHTIYYSLDYSSDLMTQKNSSLEKTIIVSGNKYYKTEEEQKGGIVSGNSSVEVYYDSNNNLYYTKNHSNKWVAVSKFTYSLSSLGSNNTFYISDDDYSSLSKIKDLTKSFSGYLNSLNSIFAKDVSAQFYEKDNEYSVEQKNGNSWITYKLKVDNNIIKGLKVIEESFTDNKYNKTEVFVLTGIGNTKFDLPKV